MSGVADIGVMIENLGDRGDGHAQFSGDPFHRRWRHLSSGLSYCVTVITFTLTVKFVTSLIRRRCAQAPFCALGCCPPRSGPWVRRSTPFFQNCPTILRIIPSDLVNTQFAVAINRQLCVYASCLTRWRGPANQDRRRGSDTPSVR